MAQPRVLVLQHTLSESAGRILDSLDDTGIDVEIASVVDEKNPTLPNFGSVAGVVLMGGPMGATDYEDHPGLKAEAKLARACVTSGKPLLGVCLGHQIIATALGAKLKKGKEPEIGYAPVQHVGSHDFFPMFSKELTVLNWHEDSVTLPQGAQLLASSKHTKNEAFRLGSALGLQFHAEVKASTLDEWLKDPAMVGGLKKSKVQSIRDDFEKYDSEIAVFADAIFSGFAARCVTYARSL